jgi:DNA adenine methylase
MAANKLSATILKLIPAHKIYVEPFIGGAAIYFAKEPAPCEVINDTNGELVNFYEVLKRDFPALQQEIETSLLSRKQHHQASVIYNNPDCSTALSGRGLSGCSPTRHTGLC